MNEPIDQTSRQRFVTELDKNFSVVAAAGSGKTRAITDRIVQIARAGASPSDGEPARRAAEWLPQLVVVAFTNRAADEMQQRARSEILSAFGRTRCGERAKVPLHILPAFDRVFFGTIHAFCVQLLESYGHHLGLPPQVDLVTDDTELWNDFVQQYGSIGRTLSDKNRRELLRHVQVRALMELGRQGDLHLVDGPTEECPCADFDAIYRYIAKGSAKQTIPYLQEELKRANRIWRETEDFIRWPGCNTAAKDFLPIWREAFGPLRQWIDQCALCVAAEVQRDYREFRIAHGLLTYDDQVALALELLQNPETARLIRAQNFRVILDEAQDTDPRQFSLLLELTRPPGARGEWLETLQDPPQAGHFCMVGDFQQSIYSDRADLSRYRKIHQTLVETGAAEALKFSVTFRLDTKQLDFVNATFRQIFNKIENQVEFVKLSPRPEILPGQVVRLNLDAGKLIPDARGKISESRKAAEEGRQLACWLRATGLAKLRARTWRDVAILCPRKDWLQTLRRALRNCGFTVQIQSEKEWKGDNPAYAWATALCTIMSQPHASYEIVGVLREVFGIPDHDLAIFSCGFGDRFQIETFTNGPDMVSKTLCLLAQMRLSTLEQPLFDAINQIVDQTRLRERLRVLPSEDFEDLDAELDSLLALAAASESERLTLSEFAELLREHFCDPREARPSQPDAIQLITSQKAKGSEWQAVIVPFLAREVRAASPRYPSILKKAGETIVLLDASDVTPEIKDALELKERQQMERLLYVALTRARHTLVLAFDQEFFAKSSGELHKDSQAKWLRADNENSEVLDRISPAANECLKTIAYQAKEIGKPEELPPAFGVIDNELTQTNASIFVRKINPSELPRQEDQEREYWISPGVERIHAASTPALRYGVWWHEFVRHISWRDGERNWKAMFEQVQSSSPDQTRGVRELRLLRDHLESGADFRRILAGAGAFPEMPFFWCLDENRCLEGIVDLALFDRDARKCLILDWKTDRVTANKLDLLRIRYRAQLAAYWVAIREMTACQVEAAIYSTPTASLLRYRETELAAEWARLRKLPAEQLLSEISVNSKEPAEQLEFAALA
jgi:ATP-dependent exoDNAse (exonuclease V) beta subunit